MSRRERERKEQVEGECKFQENEAETRIPLRCCSTGQDTRATLE
jgi:hypothetical protein